MFEWLIASSTDAHGNAIRYEYAAEDLACVDRSRPSEARRGSPCNRYVKRILFGNRRPLESGDDIADAGWMFETVFAYGGFARK